jgi:enoyl-CoA hydratase/carnithine racemase
VWVLDLGDDENRFSPAFLDRVDGVLDGVEAAVGPRALVTTGGGRFFSNGLDLAWADDHPELRTAYVARVQRLLARFLTLPMPTVAAVNGHAFGAGAMLAIVHDYRVMRDDRGYLCLPEVDLGLPFTTGMARLIQSKVVPRTAVAAMTTGRRYGGPDALDAGLVDRVTQREQLVPTARAMAAELTSKAGATLKAIKETMYAEVVRALVGDVM